MNLREWALPVYTILTQMALGALLMLWIVRAVGIPKIGSTEMDRMAIRPMVAIWCTALVALFGSHFHLSRPFLSFLALLNVGSSWLSREVLFTTLFFFSISVLVILLWFVRDHARLKTLVGWFAIICGSGSIFCMAAIYLLPVQPAWNTPLTVISFYSTALLLGIVAISVLLVLDLKFSEMREPNDQHLRRKVVQRALAWFAVGAAVMTLVVLSLNIAQIYWLENGNELAHLSLELLLGLYRPLFVIRLGLLMAGAASLILAVWTTQRTKKTVAELMIPAYVSCLFVLVGEILGRFLFYATHIRLGV